MKKTIGSVFFAFVFLTALLSGCAPFATSTTSPTTMPTITQSATPEPTAILESIGFPLSESGSYYVGIKRNIAYEDPSRNGRKITITIWYPAMKPQDSTSGDPIADAMPDLTNAPYPLLLSSTKIGSIFATHLASYGFVYVGVNGLDTFLWDKNLIDQPLDILFALHQVASNPIEGLEGTIDAEHAGVMGYSFDGYNSLALSGARVDPEYYLEFCANHSLEEHVTSLGYCDPANTWDAFSDHAGSAITTSNDGLWQPMTDDRIRAVMPMAPDGAILFGERGLASVDRPTLIIGATEDDICTYNHEAVYIFEHISESNRTMISFVGKGHMMIYSADPVAYMKHFATAFFGYYLQRQDDYSKYFSEDFVAQHNGLFWGVYKK
jgi:predicted dienelactone hydrolase